MNEKTNLNNDKRKYEFRALICGIIINFFSVTIGFTFFLLTGSMSILLDALISGILCGSTIASIFVSNAVTKKNNKKYPLGRCAIENMFLLFRSIMMLGTILFTIIDGFNTITQFAIGNTIGEVNINNLYLILYCILMVVFCLLITLSYAYFNRKEKSSIISLEIKSSIYDGLVTLFAISSLLIFSNIEALHFIAPIGDSITVIILSIFYIYSPIKELVGQIRILTGTRSHNEKEKKLISKMETLYQQFEFVDLFYSYSGYMHNIYLTLYPKQEMNSKEIEESFESIRAEINKKYTNSSVYLLLSHNHLHDL